MSTPNSTMQQMQKLNNDVHECERKIVVFARSLVPTLRDAGREHAATELDRLLFDHEALTGEVGNFFKANIDSVMEMFKGPR